MKYLVGLLVLTLLVSCSKDNDVVLDEGRPSQPPIITQPIQPVVTQPQPIIPIQQPINNMTWPQFGMTRTFNGNTWVIHGQTGFGPGANRNQRDYRDQEYIKKEVDEAMELSRLDRLEANFSDLNGLWEIELDNQTNDRLRVLFDGQKIQFIQVCLKNNRDNRRDRNRRDRRSRNVVLKVFNGRFKIHHDEVIDIDLQEMLTNHSGLMKGCESLIGNKNELVAELSTAEKSMIIVEFGRRHGAKNRLFNVDHRFDNVRMIKVRDLDKLQER